MSVHSFIALWQKLLVKNHNALMSNELKFNLLTHSGTHGEEKVGASA